MIYEIIGVPGVGKTFLAKELNGKYDVYFSNQISIIKDIFFLIKGNISLLVYNSRLFFWLWLFFFRFSVLKNHRFNFFKKQKLVLELLYYGKKEEYILDQFILQYISTSALKSERSIIVQRLFECYLNAFDIKVINLKANNYSHIINVLKKRCKYWDRRILSSEDPSVTLKEIEKFHDFLIECYNLPHINVANNEIKVVERFLGGAKLFRPKVR